jgi:tetratricopeptide (TPR) repeat protein
MDLSARLAGIVDSFYDLRFEEAQAGAAGIEKDFPGHPAGPFYAAMVQYQRYLIENPPSDATLARFEAGIRDVVKACEGIRTVDEHSAERYLGAAYGFSARALVAQGNYWSALLKARKAVGHLKKAAELDPSDDDTKLGLGMYEYFLSRTPTAAKPFAYLLIGMRGNRERGLEHLKRSAAGSGPARMEARSVLSAIYASDRERRWSEAQELLQELISRYPGNPLYRLRAVYVAQRRKDWPSARELADPESGWVERLAPAIRERARLEAHRRIEETARLAAGTLSAPQPPRWPLPGLPND